MAETRWTKGPWEARISPKKGLGGVVFGGGEAVAVTAHREDEAEYRANAHLIAASTDLYRRLARRVTNCGCFLGDGVRCLECAADRNVLARARGEGADDG